MNGFLRRSYASRRRTMDALLLAIMTLSLLVAASPVEAKHFSGMTWSRTYENIVGRSDVQTTSDGGFIVTGVSDRPWVLKTNALGEPGWEKGYSLSGYCYLSQVGSIQETRDRGYLL